MKGRTRYNCEGYTSDFLRFDVRAQPYEKQDPAEPAEPATSGVTGIKAQIPTRKNVYPGDGCRSRKQRDIVKAIFLKILKRVSYRDE